MDFRTRRVLTSALSLTMLLALPGCGKSSDPRCNSVCAVKEPDVAGSGDVCSDSSADQCKEECNTRIAGVPSLCATCLLEGAEFYSTEWHNTNGTSCRSPAPCASGSQCTMTADGQECQYCEDDIAAEEDCLRQLFPRQTVDCKVHFESVTKCDTVCGAPAQ